MKFRIETWQNMDGTFTAWCTEEQGFRLCPQYGAYYHKKLDGFPTREAALAAIKKVIDAFLALRWTNIDHGVYP